MRQIDYDLALKIAKKLEAILSQGSAHQLAEVYHNGVVVSSFGLRRSSKSVGHDYIPRDIHTSMHRAKLLGRCPLSKADYIKELQKKGLI
jgi:hypothetical protein